jgi:hypothetical protein
LVCCVADLDLHAEFGDTALDHAPGIDPVHRRGRERAGAADGGAEQGALFVAFRLLFLALGADDPARHADLIMDDEIEAGALAVREHRADFAYFLRVSRAEILELKKENLEKRATTVGNSGVSLRAASAAHGGPSLWPPIGGKPRRLRTRPPGRILDPAEQLKGF